MLRYVADNASELTTSYGNVSCRPASGQSSADFLKLERQGGDKFFGEPALNLEDMMQTDQQGQGYIDVLAADKLMQSPKLYGTFLLWMLAELLTRTYQRSGDLDQPKMVSFFRRGSSPL
jgi:DNA helicase HerA-like ATPase